MDFEIWYRPGLENKAADALPRQMMYQAILVVQASLWETIAAEIEEDSQLQHIIKALQQGLATYSSYSLEKGRLFYQGQVVIPKDSSQIPYLAEFHDSVAGGHSSFLKT